MTKRSRNEIDAALDDPTPDLLLAAYARGVFPMADPETGAMEWFCPDPRAVIPLDAFHVPRTLARTIRQELFQLRSDTAFEEVMRSCGPARDSSEPTWIDERLVRAYVGLHARGHAHSVESWRDGKLVGGLYGVHIGAAFFGESMFVKQGPDGTDASKVCLVHLVNHLRDRGFTLLDTQFSSEHLSRFGCVEIPAVDYLSELAIAISQPVTWGGEERETPFDKSATS